MAASTSKVAIVTGANQGIGYGIASRLARLWPTSYYASQSPASSSSPSPLTLYFTARNVERGQQSFEALRKELQEQKTSDGNAVLSEDGGLTQLIFHQLDITDAGSRQALRDTLKKDQGGLDLLINNAGIAVDGFTPETVDKTLKTNYWATRDLTTLLVPEMRKGGRVVTVASMAGKLKGYSPALSQRFKDAHASDSTEQADALMSDFQRDVNSGDLEDNGWKIAAYSVSKAGVIALHGALSNKYGKEGKDILVATCCPGYVDTQMTKHKGVRHTDEGASTPVTLALSEVGSDKGGSFWENDKESQWY
ncbi:unnamed protein product [Parajaminaea phylloscopi]